MEHESLARERVAEEASRRVGWALHQADVALQAAKEPGLRSVGVPAAHYALLMHVHLYPGLSGAALARRMGVSPQAVASLAGKLESEGLLERRSHEHHLRVQELHLTERGFDALRVSYAEVTRIETVVRDALGPERTQALAELLGVVTGTLRGLGRPEEEAP